MEAVHGRDRRAESFVATGGGGGRPALLLHGGPAVPDYMAGCAELLVGLFEELLS